MWNWNLATELCLRFAIAIIRSSRSQIYFYAQFPQLSAQRCNNKGSIFIEEWSPCLHWNILADISRLSFPSIARVARFSFIFFAQLQTGFHPFQTQKRDKLAAVKKKIKSILLKRQFSAFFGGSVDANVAQSIGNDLTQHVWDTSKRFSPLERRGIPFETGKSLPSPFCWMLKKVRKGKNWFSPPRLVLWRGAMKLKWK